MNKAKRGMTAPLNLFFIFTICRVIICLTYIQSVTTGKFTSHMSLSVILSLGITLIISLPALLCTAKNKSPVDVKGLNLLYSLYFIFLAAVNVSRFSYFASTRLNPDSKGWVFALMIILAATYGAYLGIEAIGRFAMPAFIAIAGAIALVLAANVKSFEFTSLFPIYQVGWKQIITDSLILSANTTEIVMLMSIRSKVNGKFVKAFTFSMIASYVTVALVFLFVSGVLGDSASLQSFPVYTLSQLANFGTGGRLDAVYMMFWIVSIFIKGAMLVYCASVTSKKYKHSTKTALSGLAAFGLSLIITSVSNPSNFSYLVIVIPFVIFSIIIPFVLCFVTPKVKEKKEVLPLESK